MKDTVRIGLVGAGRIATTHAAAIHNVPGAVLSAIAEPNPAARHNVASQWGVPGFAAHDEPGFSELCDVAIVAAPPVFHTRIAIDLMAAGLDLLVEKPFAIDVESAKLMLGAADEHGRVIAVASKYRYAPDVREARRLVEEGAIGMIQSAEVTFSSEFDPGERWHAIPSISGGGVISDNAPHAADLVRYVLGPIEEVAASEGPRRPGLEVEDEATLLLATPLVEVMTYLSWRRHIAAPYLKVIGDQGVLNLDWKSTELIRPGEVTPIGTGFDRMRAFQSNLTNFLESVSRQDLPSGAHADAIAAVEVVIGLYRSLASGAVERITAPLSVSA
jgi:predicted dehydrogenase